MYQSTSNKKNDVLSIRRWLDFCKFCKAYKKFTYTQQSSYRLDHIGKIEVNIGKVEYDGSLDDLYRDDINKYI